jgi:hypothetical protein
LDSAVRMAANPSNENTWDIFPAKKIEINALWI